MAKFQRRLESGDLLSLLERALLQVSKEVIESFADRRSLLGDGRLKLERRRSRGLGKRLGPVVPNIGKGGVIDPVGVKLARRAGGSLIAASTWCKLGRGGGDEGEVELITLVEREGRVTPRGREAPVALEQGVTV